MIELVAQLKVRHGLKIAVVSNEGRDRLALDTAQVKAENRRRPAHE